MESERYATVCAEFWAEFDAGIIRDLEWAASEADARFLSRMKEEPGMFVDGDPNVFPITCPVCKGKARGKRFAGRRGPCERCGRIGTISICAKCFEPKSGDCCKEK